MMLSMQIRKTQIARNNKLTLAAKWTVVTTVSAALLTATTLPVSAGNSKKPSGGKTVNKITKRVTAKAGNKNQFNGNSNSRAKVNNSINVNVGGGNSGGGGRIVLNRGNTNNKKNVSKNNNNGNNGNDKKKKVVRRVINNIVTYEIVDSYNTTTINETNIIDSYNTDITKIEDSYNKYTCPTCSAKKDYQYPKNHSYNYSK